MVSHQPEEGNSVYVVTCVDGNENHHVEVFADYDKASAAYSVSLARYGKRASITSRKVIH